MEAGLKPFDLIANMIRGLFSTRKCAGADGQRQTSEPIMVAKQWTPEFEVLHVCLSPPFVFGEPFSK